MATKSSIHIKPCNIASSEAHNRRTAEYIRNIGESRIYVVSKLSTDNEQWVNPDFGTTELRTHYDNIKRMVKEKTGRAMQEKERERKGKNGKIIKVAGCSPIREGVLLIRPDTTLADVRKFGEECQRRWGITPLQIFLHKDEGHWLNSQPEAEDKESFQIGSRWFKPNYHAHIVFDWMNHDTGKSCKLNDEDMTEMQSLASDILLMERGQSKTETGKEHLERNDFIIKKQKAELQRIEETQRYKEQQVTLAEQELKQVKSEIRTNKLKSVATDAATAIASGVGSLFGSNKVKTLERENSALHQVVATHEETIETLQFKIQTIQADHSRQVLDMQQKHIKELQVRDTEHKKEVSRLTALLNKTLKWFPQIKGMLNLERFCLSVGFNQEQTAVLMMGKPLEYSGELYSEEHKRKFMAKDVNAKVFSDNGRLILTIDLRPIGDWFKEQFEKLKQGLNVRQSRFKL